MVGRDVLRIVFDGVDLTRAHARRFLEAGIGHIPEDRQRQGLILNFSLAENLGLREYRRAPASRFGWLKPNGPNPRPLRGTDRR